MPSVPLTPAPGDSGPASALAREPPYGFTRRKLRLQSAGALRSDALYVERAADAELLAALLAGESCTVVGAPQLGKSSLRLHLGRQLDFEHGRSCAHLDLHAVGPADAASSQEGLFFALVQLLAEALRLESPLPFFHGTGGALAPAQRFRRYLREVALARAGRPVVVFVDGLDRAGALGVAGAELWAILGALDEERARDPALRPLTLCLLGAAEAGPHATGGLPCPIGRVIRLCDFSRRELAPFAPTLAALGGSPAAWLDAIYDWTGGHPGMTNTLCARLAQSACGAHLASPDPEPINQRVDEVVAATFLAPPRAQDPSLRCIESALDSHPRCIELLGRYRRLLPDPQAPLREEDPLERELASLGLCAIRPAQGGGLVLQVRNRICQRVFSGDWAGAAEVTHRFDRALQTWRESGKSPDTLLRGSELERVKEWALAHPGAVRAEHTELLLSSLGEAKRQSMAAAADKRIRRQRLVILALAALLLGVTVLCGVLYAQVRAARSSRPAGVSDRAADNPALGRLALPAQPAG